ncbi:hypothetical protein QN363_13640 [Undibacterium sp. CCC2.1]|uniref:hypothetical protein n=1 Tax=unclassified Undibacterium TaxID=2630295 RepID=UPI002B235695|nr:MULTISPECIES: hypothetical protein [unclassified Undibacterium]MEB0140066.1 hypothetical protein [Undibacterium sp. CCC2.1]
MTQDNILSFGKLKYLKLALALMALCIILYAFDNPPLKPNGGTPLGYGLGTVAALLILWLLAFGMRKRAYHSTLGTLRGWLSAHVYLGLALTVVATLHTGFEFAWNIHTLAYALTIAVILSGFWGVVLYLRQPAMMGNLLNGQTLQQYGQSLRDLDDECRQLAGTTTPEIQACLAESARAHIFDAYWQRFTGRNRHCATQQTLTALEQNRAERTPLLQEIYTLQFRRLQQLNRIRAYVRLKSWTEVWLIVHVPLSFALLACLIAHIVAVFFYW